MRRRSLGAGGPAVGAIGLGCMPMSWAYLGAGEDEDASVRVVHRALDLGVTLLDTADVYGPFTNESLVGRALAGRRDDDAVVATKTGLVVGANGGYPLANDARPSHVRDAIDGSLERLGVDEVDLWYLHRVDPEVPLEETWGAMAEQVAAGKARALGMSEVTVDELERAHAVHPVAAVQSELSLWFTDRLQDVVPWCAANGAAFVPYAPLGRGFLTGELATAQTDPRDFRSRLPRFADGAIDENRAIVERVRTVADRHGATPGQVALAWTLAQGDHVIPIPGTRRVRHLEENAAAADLVLSPDDLTELAALPAATGERY
jgi:aryl-alcohol dehydrogenase-like predicted oxidoreductase